MAGHDDKAQARREKALNQFAALDNADIDDFLRRALLDEKGQKALWWMLQIGKYGIQPFSVDGAVTAFQCGEMNVGQQLVARIIDVNPLGFAEMQLRRKAEDDRRNEYANNASAGDDLFADDPDD